MHVGHDGADNRAQTQGTHAKKFPTIRLERIHSGTILAERMFRLQIGSESQWYDHWPVPAYHWLRNLTRSLARKPRDSIQIVLLVVARVVVCHGSVFGASSVVVDNLRSARLRSEGRWRFQRHRG